MNWLKSRYRTSCKSLLTSANPNTVQLYECKLGIFLNKFSIVILCVLVSFTKKHFYFASVLQLTKYSTPILRQMSK